VDTYNITLPGQNNTFFIYLKMKYSSICRHNFKKGSAMEKHNFGIWHTCNYSNYKYAIVKQNFEMKFKNSASLKHYPL
jgi:hypothetical protein